VTAPPKLAPGQKFGPYALLAKLATGGMGEIFLARRSGAAGFEKLVVIKRLLPHLAEDEHFVAMFLDEARLAASISHPNVCQVHELDQVDGQHYIAMEYLEGVTLSAMLRRARKSALPLDLRLATTILAQACEGLHHAHELVDAEGNPVGLVHRDVSPSNLFVTMAGVVKILDFGVAKSQQAMAKTRTGSVKGKYAYMSPEQITLGDLDRRSDIFSLGIVSFEALTNRRLFARASEYFVLRAITEDPIPEARSVRADIPEELSAVVGRALAREAEDRFATARELGVALNQAVSALGPPLGNAAIGDYLQAHFAAELAENRSVVKVSMRAARMAEKERHSDVGEKPTVEPGLREDEVATRVDRPETEPGLRLGAARRWPWVLAAVAVLGGAAAVAASGVLAGDRAPEPVIVNQGSVEADRRGAPAATVDAAVAASSSIDAGAAAADASAPAPRDRGPRRPPPRRDPYSAAFAAHQGAIAGCFNRHAVDVEGSPELAVRLRIEADGRVSRAALTTPALEGTAVGRCIVDIARGVSFAAQDDPVTVTIPLKVRRSAR
jgi:hypothetical protein